MPEERRLSPIRKVLFAGLVTTSFLLAANLIIEQLERTGWLETTRQSSPTQVVAEALFQRQGERLVTTPYAEQTLVPLNIDVNKGAAVRIAVLGGSWAMGSPYVVQGEPLRPGGVVDYLRLVLAGGREPVEVLNLAAGGQDSHRVRAVADEALRLEPDALVVATCNNEGTPGPSHVQRFLSQQAGVRLLMKLRPASEPSWFTAQDPETDRIREQFVENLQAIASLAQRAGVPLILATLPINLEYSGFDLGHLRGPGGPPPTSGRAQALADEPAPLPDEPLLAGLPPCVAGVRLAEVGALEAGQPYLQRCLADDAADPHFQALVPAYLAAAHLARGTRQEDAMGELSTRFSPCIAEGIAEHLKGESEAAVQTLSECVDDVAEALRWKGLALAELGDNEAAESALRQSVEFKPRNRCRPSFNAAIRAVAQEHSHVTLLDLEAEYAALADPPGPEPWFLDYCHMSWRGYAAMGRAVASELGVVLPQLQPQVERLPDDPTFQRRYRLPAGDGVEQWTRLLTDWFAPGGDEDR